MDKRLAALKKVADKKDNMIEVKVVSNFRVGQRINPGVPKRTGRDVTDLLNKMYCKLIEN